MLLVGKYVSETRPYVARALYANGAVVAAISFAIEAIQHPTEGQQRIIVVRSVMFVLCELLGGAFDELDPPNEDGAHATLSAVFYALGAVFLLSGLLALQDDDDDGGGGGNGS